MNPFYQIISDEYARQRERAKALVDMGYLIPVKSYSEYEQKIKVIRSALQKKMFSNNAILRNDIERLIGLGDFYEVANCSGCAFVIDKRSHWEAYLNFNIDEKFYFPKLDKSVLINFFGRGVNFDSQREGLEAKIFPTGFKLYETFQQVDGIPKLNEKAFMRLYHAAMKALEKEGAHICTPNDDQLYELEAIYIQEVNIFSRHFFTMDERRKQRDEGLLKCVLGKNNEVLAIHIASQIMGGLIAAKHNCLSNIYAPALVIDGMRAFYAKNAQIRPKDRYGWIAETNTASNNLYGMLKIEKTGKYFVQYILPGFLY